MTADAGNNDQTRSFVMLAAGTPVGRYRIISRIGAGGMGEVYLAEDTELNRKVALKFLPPHLCQDEDCRRRFRREAQAAAKLSHPNIIHVYEVSEYQGRPFFAMEHVDGRSLQEYASSEDMPIERVLEIGIQVCEGLNDAHEEGVTHRDIKPSNILIDAHGRVKIVDFGLASVIGADQLTRTGSTLGTIGYMSPEQVQGKEVDQRSDLFSLGVVLYELITGRNPFKRDTEAATLKAVSDDLPEPLARFKSGLPEGLQGVVDKALDKDAKTRYQHADGLSSDLMRIKRSLESVQSVISGVPSGKHPTRTLWITAAIIIVAAVILILTKPWQTETASPESDKIMLAVLPFENMGNPEDEYFADGITEEVTGKLARLTHLGVTSRTSSMQYKASGKSIREIGRELGVAYVLEGTVRWVHQDGESRVRVQPQLIRAEDDIHIWAEDYDFVLEDILEIQSSIALAVAEALDLSLLAPDRKSLSDSRQVNPEAYQLYLKSKSYHGWDISKSESALADLRRAVELDPDFAPARGALARAIIWHFRNFGQKDIDLVHMAREHAALAITTDPNSADGYIALSDYARIVDEDFGAALDYLDTALFREPNNTDALSAMGGLMFMEGNFQASYHFYKKACQLDPGTPRTMFATVLYWQRKWDELLDYIVSVLVYQPDNLDFQMLRAWALAEKYVSVDSLLANMPPSWDTLAANIDLYGNIATAAYVVRDYDRLLAICKSRLPYDLTDGDSALTYMNFAWAYSRLEPSSQNFYADSALSHYDRFLTRDTVSGFMTLVTHTHMAAMYALSGNRVAADSLCQEVLRRGPVNNQRSLATVLNFCAMTYALIGKEEEAIDILEDLINRPSLVSLFGLKTWEAYDSLRDHPRFQAIIQKYEKEHGT